MKAANASRETAGVYLRAESLRLVLGAGLLLMCRLLGNQSLCEIKRKQTVVLGTGLLKSDYF